MRVRKFAWSTQLVNRSYSLVPSIPGHGFNLEYEEAIPGFSHYLMEANDWQNVQDDGNNKN